MLFERQKRLLAFLDTLGGEVGSLDFQKLLFLYCTEVEEVPTYEFVPYRFGGYSFSSCEDKRRLIVRGLLNDEERIWKLTQSGRALAKVDGRIHLAMDRFAKSNRELRGDALVAEAYRRHPYYAIRSEMADRVLDQNALDRIATARPQSKGPGLCTIGYEGLSLENYLNRLIRSSVTLLCDVRRNPLSRKYGFSKGALRKACENLAIRYEHIPALGIASEDRRELRTQADYDSLFEEYERESLSKQANALKKIRSWIESGERVALTCFEKVPHQCHRHCVADALERLDRTRMRPVHL